MHADWSSLIHEFHNLSWITEINELFHDILIYWDAPVYSYSYLSSNSFIAKVYGMFTKIVLYLYFE